MASELRALGTRPLAKDAADAIREEILSGRLRRGEHLVEARLASQLNVSRGPIREALQVLRAEGLVHEKPRRGTFVVRLSSRDVREIYDLRASVEGAAARMVAVATDRGVVEELHSIIDRMSGGMERRDLTAIGRADLDFHEAICRLSGNRRLHAAFQGHVPAVRTVLKIDELLYSSAQIVDSHRPILDAIERREADLAQVLCETHCRQARDQTVAYLESLGDL
jgi:GntR family transcriptional regulator of gluconate operon